MNITDKLRHERLSRDLTETELAKLIGLKSASSISHYENGTRKPSLIILQKIANVYSYTLSELLEGVKITL